MSAQNPKKNTYVDKDDLQKVRYMNPSVAAVFGDQERANWAIARLKKEGFSDNQIEGRPAPLIGDRAHLVVVHNTQRAITALEILVNAGGDTHINQTEHLAEMSRL